MGRGRFKRRRRKLARLRANLEALELRDALRRLEVADTDAHLSAAQDRERKARELAGTLVVLVCVLCELLQGKEGAS